jgi:flagella basal body P-ring formation protein FlgA
VKPSRPARFFVTLVALLANASTLRAQVPPPASGAAALPPPAVAQALALAGRAAAARAPAGARIEAMPLAPDPRLKLAPCTRAEPYLGSGAPPWGRTRVGLRCTEGANWSISLPVQVHVWAPAWTTRGALPAGTPLAQDLLERAETDWAAAGAPPLADLQALLGRVLARPVAAGQALRATDLRARQWFASGERVRVVSRGDGFAVSAEGQALNAGVEGQPVRVRTESGRVVVGSPVGPTRVELAL